VRCLVTAGPTFEPLDQVRRLTNFSTGRLGSELADYLAERHLVTLLLSQQATWRSERHAARVEPFTTTDDLSRRLRDLATEGYDAVFHAAAVSDFRFGKVWQRTATGELTEVQAGKIPTRLGPLTAELLPTTKIISHLREWFPAARLVGWKYDVEGDRDAVIRQAREQIAACHTDACVANGPAYGLGFGLVTAGDALHLSDTPSLFSGLEALIGSGLG